MIRNRKSGSSLPAIDPAGPKAAGPQAIGQETIGQEAGGIFTEWSWDGRRLTLSNDRYGVYPAYYSHWNGRSRCPHRSRG